MVVKGIQWCEHFFSGRECMEPVIKKQRRYTGPPKGSAEAKERMQKVRAAQWAKNGLILSKTETDDAPPTAQRA